MKCAVLKMYFGVATKSQGIYYKKKSRYKHEWQIS